MIDEIAPQFEAYVAAVREVLEVDNPTLLTFTRKLTSTFRTSADVTMDASSR